MTDRATSCSYPPEGTRVQLDNLTSSRASSTDIVSPFEFDGKTFIASRKRTGRRRRRAWIASRWPTGCIASGRNSLAYVRYLDDFPVPTLEQRLGRHADGELRRSKVYVVQTNHQGHRALHADDDRPGDLVLDPTCGSGTTALRRRAVGPALDHHRHVARRARARRQRLMGARFPVLPARRLGRGPAEGRRAVGPAACRPPRRTNDIRHGFVYERVQHITLKSIANNPDIKEGMTREEIDAAIRRHAEFELLYDKPYEDTKKVRVVRAVHGREPVAAPLARVRRQRGRRHGRAERRRRSTLTPAATRRSSRRSSTTSARPASRTAARSERLDLRHGRAVRRRPTSRRSATARTRRTGRRSGSGSRSARSTARSARRSSRTPPARRSGPATSTCCACSPSRSTRRCSGPATTT